MNVHPFNIVFLYNTGGQSDQGYDSLSKEEERVNDNTPLVDQKTKDTHRKSCEFGWICILLHNNMSQQDMICRDNDTFQQYGQHLC